MARFIRTLKWRLNADGGGEALLFEPNDTGITETKLVFGNLDELPTELSSVIRADGRDAGEVELE